jgi:alkylhydroperoxidase family enzyme
MGHGNMLLAVAGLKHEEVKQRTRNLAEGNWGAFAPAERQAFAFAEKLSSRPADVTDADVKDLTATFGPERAVDLIWYSSWVNFMTRVADAFQFNLERENVFVPPAAKKSAAEAAQPVESKR